MVLILFYYHVLSVCFVSFPSGLSPAYAMMTRKEKKMFSLEDVAQQGHGLVNSDIARVSAVLYPGRRYHGLCAKFHRPPPPTAMFFHQGLLCTNYTFIVTLSFLF